MRNRRPPTLLLAAGALGAGAFAVAGAAEVLGNKLYLARMGLKSALVFANACRLPTNQFILGKELVWKSAMNRLASTT